MPEIFLSEEDMQQELTDSEFLEQFENKTLPAEQFHHSNHVRMAWIYLQRGELLEALEKFSASLKLFAKAKGASNRYHETITWAYIFLINERINRTGETQNWEQFAADNEDLLVWKPNILEKYYRPETLKSKLAKQTFVFPDLW